MNFLKTCHRFIPSTIFLASIPRFESSLRFLPSPKKSNCNSYNAFYRYANNKSQFKLLRSRSWLGTAKWECSECKIRLAKIYCFTPKPFSRLCHWNFSSFPHQATFLRFLLRWQIFASSHKLWLWACFDTHRDTIKISTLSIDDETREGKNFFHVLFLFSVYHRLAN